MKMPKNRSGALLIVPTHRIRLGNEEQQWAKMEEKKGDVEWEEKSGRKFSSAGLVSFFRLDGVAT